MSGKRIYDNTNLAESYAGAVSPLTASFARDLYEGVYRHFVVFMGVSADDQKTHDAMFSRMIVSIGYHLYYDILNWYTLVSLLPGYAYNKPFFERMLGIPEGAIEIRHASGRFAARFRLLTQIIRIGAVFLAMPILIIRFNRRFDRAFARMSAMRLSAMSYEALCTHYQHVRRDLVRLWRVPIANDFAVMVSTGVSRTLYQKWVGDDAFATHLALSSRASLASLDPGRLLLRIRAEIDADPTMSSVWTAAPKDAYRALQERQNGATRLVDAYIERYGSRVPNELKLEAPTLVERPELIIGMLRASRGLFEERVGGTDAVEIPLPVIGLLRRSVLSFFLAWARASIRRREETRLRRTQIFGHARQVFLAMGKLLARQDLISDPHDIMYLTAEEACSAAWPDSLKDRIAARKREMDSWKTIHMPNRIESDETIGAIEQSIREDQVPRRKMSALRGMVASRAGKSAVSGSALVLKEFDPAADYADRILVTRHTDPGWTVVFPLVRAIVVERGGILSHASIVAREMGIPCIIGVAGATDGISDRSEVTLDLEHGTISV